MKTATVHIEGVSPYAHSKYFDRAKIGQESDDDLEKRTWRGRIHTNAAGEPFMPPMGLKKCLEAASAYLGKIPGQRNATYTKRFKSGILITEEIPLWRNGKPATLDDFEGEWLFLDANGKPGGTRVKRCMPRIMNPWSAIAQIIIVDEVITKDVLERAVLDAGILVGMGRFRPSVGGFYGRFKLVDLKLS